MILFQIIEVYWKRNSSITCYRQQGNSQERVEGFHGQSYVPLTSIKMAKYFYLFRYFILKCGILNRSSQTINLCNQSQIFILMH